MTVESTSATDPIANTPNNGRGLLRAHVAALVVTAAVVVPLLLGTASIPAWVSTMSCIIIASVAIGFVVAAREQARHRTDHNPFQRNESLIVAIGLSIAQLIFIVPVLICVYAPTLRL